MLKKIIVSSVAIVLVGAATAGSVYFATRKDDRSSVKKNSDKKANAIIAIDPKEQDDGVNGLHGADISEEKEANDESPIPSDDGHYYKYFKIFERTDPNTKQVEHEFAVDRELYTDYPKVEYWDGVNS